MDKQKRMGLPGVLPEDLREPLRDELLPWGKSQLELFQAVLEDAVACFLNGLGNSEASPQRLVAEAKEWLNSNDTDWLFSFLNVCKELGVDPAQLRAELAECERQWKEAQEAHRSGVGLVGPNIYEFLRSLNLRRRL